MTEVHELRAGGGGQRGGQPRDIGRVRRRSLNWLAMFGSHRTCPTDHENLCGGSHVRVIGIGGERIKRGLPLSTMMCNL